MKVLANPISYAEPQSPAVSIYLFRTLFSKLHNAIVVSKKAIVLGLHVVSESVNYAIVKNHSRSLDFQTFQRRKPQQKQRIIEGKQEKKRKARGCITAGNEPIEP